MEEPQLTTTLINIKAQEVVHRTQVEEVTSMLTQHTLETMVAPTKLTQALMEPITMLGLAARPTMQETLTTVAPTTLSPTAEVSLLNRIKTIMKHPIRMEMSMQATNTETSTTAANPTTLAPLKISTINKQHTTVSR